MAVGIVACSNGIRQTERDKIQQLIDFLQGQGKKVLESPCIYEKDGCFSGTGKERAAALMALYADPSVTDIFDISGGDMANEVLDELDYEQIKGSPAVFWGYSDLTTVLNAIYTQTEKAGVLFQMKNLAGEDEGAIQRQRYQEGSLFDARWQLVQGQALRGIVVGGNIRCFLKLAGTAYFPDLTGKILLMEALGGRVPQMVTYLSQLRAMGAFRKIKGILLGTFTQMEQEQCRPRMLSLVRSFAGDDLPIAITPDIGHGSDARALWIGRKIEIRREK